ncbi:MAG: DUF1501 domain-containing protein [Burkholderiales bacterium]|nr:DUF1501 domain-containing protein [Burkholderiales bacterium]
MTTRRDVIRTFGLSALGLTFGGLPGLGLAAPAAGDKRFVFVFLRGGMDGLAAVPAHGDPQFAAKRGALAGHPPGAEKGALKLDGMFALNPLLPGMHRMYEAKELLVVHAIATPYRERSHFDAQDLLENGTARAQGRDSGWLNHALGSRKGIEAIALGTTVPLVARGPHAVNAWSPSVLPAPSADTLDRLTRMYQGDPLLESALKRAREANAQVAGDTMGAQGAGQAVALARAAGTFLAKADGPRIATIDFGGWDSHTTQTGEYAALTRNFRQLDAALAALKSALGPAWAHTVVAIVTEFGRTVAPNGSGGTDHGTASAAFLAGGAVNGGRVIADWPGLADSALHERRDLMPTTDMRALFKGVLIGHLGMAESDVETKLFPDSRAVKPLERLLRS